jgi:hypothetical protein
MIEGLAPGAHEIWVAARSYLPKRIELRVDDAGMRRIVALLRPKP